jgi:hypothetical protein
MSVGCGVLFCWNYKSRKRWRWRSSIKGGGARVYTLTRRSSDITAKCASGVSDESGSVPIRQGFWTHMNTVETYN